MQFPVSVVTSLSEGRNNVKSFIFTVTGNDGEVSVYQYSGNEPFATIQRDLYRQILNAVAGIVTLHDGDTFILGRDGSISSTGNLATVATSGAYSDLVGRPPAADPDLIPATAKSLDDEFNDAAFNTNAKWTWTNQGGAAASQASSYLKLLAPSTPGVDNVRIITQPMPTGTWEVTVKLGILALADTASVHNGIIIRDSATGKFTQLGLRAVSNNALAILKAHWTNVTTNSSASILNTSVANMLYFRVKDDTTNFTWSLSIDGINWLVVSTESRTTFMANPNQVGLMIDNASNNLALTTCDFFRRSI